jgi:hypothetical protein
MIDCIENIVRGGLALAVSVAGTGAALGLADLFLLGGIVGFTLLAVDRSIAIYHGIRRVSVQQQLVEHTRAWIELAKSLERNQEDLAKRVAKLEGACVAHRAWEARHNE